MELDLTPQDDALIRLALTEDLGDPPVDRTTQALFSEPLSDRQAEVISKDDRDLVVCGLAVFQRVFETLDPRMRFEPLVEDGARIQPGGTLLRLFGPHEAILRGERTALNFIRHLTAIATITAAFVERVRHTGLKILDTRKTIPGFRRLEKYAVLCGGGVNHRMGLYDAILVKNNHIDLAGGIKVVLDRLPMDPDIPTVIEVRSPFELQAVLEHGAGKIHRILLDNMSLDLLAECVARCRNAFETEASGNITLDNIAAVAETGVNYASVGMLTHSPGPADLSMRVRMG